MPTVAVVGIQSRQHYMTVNNRLKQAVGASRLMDEAVEDFVRFGGDRLFVGGGNAAVEFTDAESARSALAGWSRKWIEDAPGIRLAAGVWSASGSLSEVYDRARKELARNEERGSHGNELGFLPLTDFCRDTGHAAQAFDSRVKQWRSLEAMQKERAGYRFNRQINSGDVERESLEWRLFSDVLGSGEYEFPVEMEDLGTRTGARHIAVCHCDGNGVGKFLEKKLGAAQGDDAARQALREWPLRLRKASESAISETFTAIRRQLPALFADRTLEPAYIAGGRTVFFPARLLAAAGDDANWICTARLGLASAVRFCQSFEHHTQQILGERRTACAGVAIVPAGFPYRRAYDLAADLCANAKRTRRDKGGDTNSSYIDFHAVTEGAGLDIDKIREANYREGVLRRPLRVTNGQQANDWGRFEANWAHFRHEWGRARSRAKRLLEETAASEDRGRECRDLFQSQGYALPAGQSAEDCFDALEMLDYHIDWPLFPSQPTEERRAQTAR